MRKFNLLVDCSYIIEIPSYTVSIHLYTGRLLQGLQNSPVFNVTALVGTGMEDYINTLACYDVDKIVVDLRKTVINRSIDRLFSLIPFENELQMRGIDVVVTPYHVDSRFFFPKRYRHHFIVHDFIFHQTLRERLHSWMYACVRIWRKILFWKVRYFISISEETRKELLRYKNKDSDVIYNSIPFNFQIQEEPVKEICGQKYILDVNRFELYKNAETLIKALYLFKDKIPHVLYLKGFNSRNSVILYLQSVVSELKMDNRVYFDASNRSEAEMRWLYSHADLLVSPSLKEGFGWTPIEAAVLKTPVLISDIDVLKEVTCGKIPTFDPYSPKDLAEKIHHTLQNPPSYDERENLARFYKERYSLQRQIDQLTKVLLSHLRN